MFGPFENEKVLSGLNTQGQLSIMGHQVVLSFAIAVAASVSVPVSCLQKLFLFTLAVKCRVLWPSLALGSLSHTVSCGVA